MWVHGNEYLFGHTYLSSLARGSETTIIFYVNMSMNLLI